MQFIKLYNMVQQLKAGATDSGGASATTYIDTAGTTRKFYTGSSSALAVQDETPFHCGGNGTVSSTSTTAGYISFCASSATEIPFNTTSVPSEIGTTSSAYSRYNEYWRCIITVTGNEGDTINSLFALRKIKSYGGNYDAVIWALKLDNPVTIDSTGTANFTFEIEFD